MEGLKGFNILPVKSEKPPITSDNVPAKSEKPQNTGDKAQDEI